jgi:hypothetical protein
MMIFTYSWHGDIFHGELLVITRGYFGYHDGRRFVHHLLTELMKRIFRMPCYTIASPEGPEILLMMG